MRCFDLCQNILQQNSEKDNTLLQLQDRWSGNIYWKMLTTIPLFLCQIRSFIGWKKVDRTVQWIMNCHTYNVFHELEHPHNSGIFKWVACVWWYRIIEVICNNHCKNHHTNHAAFPKDTHAENVKRHQFWIINRKHPAITWIKT